jgi:UrcA family protein
MSTRKGGEALLIRIKAAARKVCDTRSSYSPLPRKSWTTCRREAVEAAARQLNIPSLTAALNGEPTSTTVAAR